MILEMIIELLLLGLKKMGMIFGGFFGGIRKI
jgi:hypothetical protein